MNNSELDILYEDNHIVVVNKKAGQIVQGDKTGDTPLSELLKAYIKEKYNKPGDVFLGVTHRLDRPVSGVCIFARTSKALSRLNEAFKEKRIDKTYYAVTQHKPDTPTGYLEDYLTKNEKQNKSYVTQKKELGKLSKLEYKLINASDHYFLLEIKLLTGRHHQIRVQIAHHIGPIKGDLKYGYNRPNKDKSIHLHAGKIAFEHPIKKEKMIISAPFPSHDNLWNFFSKKD